eukprot:UN11851
MVGVFTSKAKPTVEDSKRLRTQVSSLRPQFSHTEKVLKEELVAILKDETDQEVKALEKSVRQRLTDLCGRSFIQNEDQFLVIYKLLQAVFRRPTVLI